MSLALLPAPTRKAGRPRLADQEGATARAFTVAHARLMGRTVRELADAYGVSERTILRWCRLAVESDCPNGAALRRLTGR